MFGFESTIYQLGSLEGLLTFISLSIFICKINKLIVDTSEGNCEE